MSRGPSGEVGLWGASQSSGRGRLLLLAIPAKSPPLPAFNPGLPPTEVLAKWSGVSAFTRGPASPSDVSIFEGANRVAGARTTAPAPATTDASSYRTATPPPLTKLATVTPVWPTDRRPPDAPRSNKLFTLY